MKNTYFRSSFFVLICSFAIACSSASSSPTSPTPAGGATTLTTGELAGTSRITAIQPAGGSAITTPADARYEVTFDGDRVSARVDCNVCAGAVSSSANVLTIGPVLACTRAACPTMSYESQVTQLLGGDHAVAASGSSMTLTSSRGRLALTR